MIVIYTALLDACVLVPINLTEEDGSAHDNIGFPHTR